MADPTPTQPSGWEYKPDGANPQAPEHLSGPQNNARGKAAAEEQDPAVTWTASEFIEHHKSAGWYMVLLLIGLAVCTGLYFLTKDKITVGAIAVCFLVFGIVAGRKPRVLPYRIDHDGLTVGKRLYTYDEFKAFAVIDEGTFSSITFLPLKRFSPGLNIYYAPEDEARILEALSTYLPVEQGKLDLFEALMRRVRF